MREVVRAAFLEVHRGRSTEDVVIDDRLNEQFLALCLGSAPGISKLDLNQTLFNLRKSATLGPVVTAPVERKRHDSYAHAAEIAARHVEDKYEVTIDHVLCDPDLRREFDSVALQITPNVDTYLLRKAALGLRKKRKLRPELIKRVADWGSVVEKHAAADLLEDLDLIPRKPGVYLFFDTTGYLYIGEASNLRTRVAGHLDHSDRKALARYLWEKGHADLQVELHSFDRESKGNRAGPRRAYESSLIRSRNPRFNIQD